MICNDPRCAHSVLHSPPSTIGTRQFDAMRLVLRDLAEDLPEEQAVVVREKAEHLGIEL